MTSSIRRSLAPIIAGALLCIAALLDAGTARAQACATVPIRVVNNVCAMELCLYEMTAVAPVCWNIPLGNSTVVFPRGFKPDGGVSLAGNTYPFNLAGCTVCYRQRNAAVFCCATVCYDQNNCTITIDPCTTPTCDP